MRPCSAIAMAIAIRTSRICIYHKNARRQRTLIIRRPTSRTWHYLPGPPPFLRAILKTWERPGYEATNRAQLQLFFIDNESTIQLLIQRLYSLPVPYSTQRSVTVDTYTASRLYPAMLEALTPVRTTRNGDCGMVYLIVSVVVRDTCTACAY